jgi:hypothetical protein
VGSGGGEDDAMLGELVLLVVISTMGGIGLADYGCSLVLSRNRVRSDNVEATRHHLALSALSSLQAQPTNQSQEGRKADFVVVGGVGCRGEGNPSRWCRFV